MTKRVVAVVVNWNGREDTLACLAALQHSYPYSPEVIVVDNGSSDGSAAAVQAAFPAAQVVALPANLHFAAGANVGIRAAMARRADYVWLLNNDALVTPDALAEMLRVAESEARIGIVGARLVHPFDPPGVIVGAYCDFDTGAIVEPPPPVDTEHGWLVVDYVWGCAMLVKTAVPAQVGLLEEAWVAYFEDADFCLRARQAGWHTVTALQAVVYHAGSKTANRVFLQQMWLRGRNWWRCFWRHAPVAKRPKLFCWLWGYRVPHLAWSTLFTIVARKVRPNGREIQLWS